MAYKLTITYSKWWRRLDGLLFLIIVVITHLPELVLLWINDIIEIEFKERT